MDLSTIAVKIVGAGFLVWTLRSTYKHIKEKKLQAATAAANQNVNQEKAASLTETLLNNILLYLWLAFMLVFSTGMIVNN